MSSDSYFKEIPSKYDPKSVENHWYSYWESNGFFHAEPDDRESYTVLIPPPNVTGVLHMGHMLNNTIQDVLVRRARMLGKNTCWVPGTDHASIATEAKVVDKLRKEGIKKSDLTRDEFLKHAWNWTEIHGGIILKQLRKLGASCDWQRTRFTLEDSLYEAVIDCFIDLYDRGLIYRDYRMVNWDPQAQTAVSDEEVIFKDVRTKLVHIKYKIDGEDEYVTIATVRPETIMADVAIAINPDDARNKHLAGKTVQIPLINRSIPVIFDNYVDPEFGTGCLKVTPAHDKNDYEIGKRHGLDVIDILNDDGTINEKAVILTGKDRFVARKEILRLLRDGNHIAGEEDYTSNVGYSERTDAVIEPRLSLQWFCRMKELARPALENVVNGHIKFHPAKMVNTYKHWMENIQDWCISRQLWWGQRIPAWYYNGNEYVIARTAGEALEKARIKSGNGDLKESEIHQDEDVLDTWFSSWLWPISVFDGFSDKNNKDIRYFYPANDLVTAPEIMFFWVARMIMAGYAFRGEAPFRNVYYHGIVRDKQRRKMSKSLGNSPDPIELIEKFGADGTRVGMLFSSPAGNDLLFDEALCEQGRNFSNKIWNAYRFLSMQMEAGKTYKPTLEINRESLADQWMLARLNQTIEEMNQDFEKFRLNDALLKIYNLIWSDFCDWYIELCKPDVQGAVMETIKLERALGFFEQLMILLHPFMPFISEEIWQRIQKRDLKNALITVQWPDHDKKLILTPVIEAFTHIQDLISSIRNIRAEMSIPPGVELDLYVKTPSSKKSIHVSDNEWIFRKLQKLKSVEIGPDVVKPKGSASSVVGKSEIYIPLEGLIDTGKESDRISKEISRLEGFLKSVNAKLSNESFVSKAPTDVILNEETKQKDAQEKLGKLRAILADFSS